MGSKLGTVVVLLVVALLGYGIYRVWDDYQADRERVRSRSAVENPLKAAAPPAASGSAGAESSGAKTPAATEPAADPEAAATPDGPPVVVLRTSLGSIVIRLDPDRSPLTVANFLAYVDSGHYDGTQFQRVAPGFCIQGGHYDEDGEEKGPLREAVPNESSNGRSNLRGTVAMARMGDPDSARDQFFVNLVDNVSLDYPRHGGSGYTVFGDVIEGMNVVDAIARVPIVNLGGAFSARPKTPVVIHEARRRSAKQ